MKMKGLVYREFFLSRKIIILEYMFAFMVIAMGILTRISMLYGNMARLDRETLDSAGNFTYYFFLYIPVIIMSCPLFSVIRSTVTDFNGKWMEMQYTFPVEESGWVIAKWIKNAIISVVAFVTGIVNACIIKSIAEQRLSFIKYSELKAIVSVIALMFVLSCIFMFISCRYKSYNGVIARIAAIAILGYIGVMLYIYRELDKFIVKHSEFDVEQGMGIFLMHEYNKLMNINIYVKIIIAFIICATAVLMYVLTVRQLKRREK